MDNPGLEHLLGGSGPAKDIQAKFENTTLAGYLRGMGYSTGQIRQIERKHGVDLDWEWFRDQYPGYPLWFVSRRIPVFNVQDLFEAPTKSDVYRVFGEEVRSDQATAMFFKAKGFTTLCVCNSQAVGTEVRTAIRFKVRDTQGYVVTMKGLIDVCRQRWPLSMGTEAF